ncbi:MAG: hypothetical protein RDU30_02895 [Desulfovibrionaceae bacterium]|nr:hypothetical protein [Desulfovibrionaceae bacterium]
MSFMLISLLVFMISACSDSSKIDDLTKENAALATELKECREAAKKTALREEDNKKEAEAFKRVKEELKNMNKTPF